MSTETPLPSPLTDTDARAVLSVSALNREVKQLLEQHKQYVWIEGELSNVVRASSGHCYFSLKDAKAQVRCALFRQHRRRSSVELDNGLQVLLRAKVTLYEPRGDYQLIVESVQAAGDGRLQLAFNALKKQLEAEGLFAERHKKPLPTFPKRIGIITSSTGAAVRDIIHVLQRRAPHIPLTIYPSLVQGEAAAANLEQALNDANAHAACDVLIVARGGGSLEDLWPFNEERVARAIFASTLPVISGVGHEIDVTIADWVADVRAPTPSAAAELVSPDREQLLNHLAQMRQRACDSLLRKLQREAQALLRLKHRLRHPKHRLQDSAQHLDELCQRLQRAIAQYYERAGQRLSALTRTLHAVSPLATLARGYAIVTTADGDTVIRDSRDVTLEQALQLKVERGTIHCQVTELCHD